MPQTARFGQVVIGPPGSGKTTYVHGLYQFYTAAGRPTACINLDPANDHIPYPCTINIAELVHLPQVMDEFDLGPNGGLIYCMEYLAEHLEDWLVKQIAALPPTTYLLFDTPGQVELITHNDCLKRVLSYLSTTLDTRLACVHLTDAHYCVDPAKYIAVCVVALTTMIHLELPHINILTKIDLLPSYGKLALPLDFYTEVQDLSYLLESLISSSPDSTGWGRRHQKLHEAMIALIEDYALVGFETLCIHDKTSVLHVTGVIDKANGYVFGDWGEGSGQSMLQAAAALSTFDDVRYAQEKFMLSQDVFDQADPEEDDEQY